MLKYFKVYNNIISAADSDIILKHVDTVLKRKKYEGSSFKTIYVNYNYKLKQI